MIRMVAFCEKARSYVSKVVQHSAFQNMVLCAILLNSVFLAFVDYSHVDENNDLITEGSIRNTITARSDPVFTIFFTVEMLMKMIALGLYGSPTTYFGDEWNWLDFVVVISGLISLAPGLPNIKILRTFRVIRPLKSIKSQPGLRKLVDALIMSFMQLGQVSIVFTLFFFIFGSMGLQFFSGPHSHARCRLTPFPVNTSWSPGLGFDEYRCLHYPNYDLLSEARKHKLTKASSPWHHPQEDCYWPLEDAEEEKRLCSLSGSAESGGNLCHHDVATLEPSEWSWCGADFDAFGNYRFTPGDIYDPSTYHANLGFGYVNFDNIGTTFLVIFQCITGADWAEMLLYKTMDSNNASLVAMYFVVLMIVGSFALLEIILGVMEGSLAKIKEEEEHARHGHNGHGHQDQQYLQLHLGNNTDGRGVKMYSELVAVDGSEGSKVDGATGPTMWSCVKKGALALYRRVDEMWPENGRLSQFLVRISYEDIVFALILANTVVLAMVYYRMSESYSNGLDAVNFLLTICFTVDAVISIAAMGPIKYFTELGCLFDFFIVVVSLVELCTSPIPSAFTGVVSTKSSGSLTALRAFRLFRIFRLFKTKELKVLMGKVVKSLISMANFVVLLLLYLVVFTIIGQTFFANLFRFDEEGRVVTTIHSEEWVNAPDQPRLNFDSFSEAFGTVFVVMTLDVWETVLFNCGRSGGDAALLFVLVAVVIGRYMLVYLFVAMLIENFEEAGEEKDDDEEGEEGVGGHLKDGGDREDLHDAKNESNFEMEESSIAVESEAAASMVVEGGVIKGEGTLKVTMISQLQTFANHPYFEAAIVTVIFVSCVCMIFENPLTDPASVTARALRVIEYVMAAIFSFEMLVRMCAFGLVGNPDAYFSNPWNWLDFVVVVTAYVSIFSLGNPEMEKMSGLRVLRIARALRPLRLINKIESLRQTVSALIRSVPKVGEIAGLLVLILFVFAVFLVGYFGGQFRSCHGAVFDNVIAGNPAYMSLLERPQPWSVIERSNETLSLFGPSSLVSQFHGGALPHSPPSHSPPSCGGGGDGMWPAAPCCMGSGLSEQLALAVRPTSRLLCECWGGEWLPYTVVRFDNVAQAVFGLFQMVTESWSDQMWACTDATGVDMQPSKGANMVWVYFWVFLIVLGSFFATSLFTAVITESFHEEKRGDMSVENEHHLRWLKMVPLIKAQYPVKQPKRPLDSIIRGVAFDICIHDAFEFVNPALAACQCICLASLSFGQSDEATRALFVGNLVIAIALILESLVKLAGLGISRYFASNWNRMDLLVSVASIPAIVHLGMTGDAVGLVVNLLKTFHMIRIAVRYSESLETIVAGLTMAFPSVCNVVVLMGLVLFTFGVICVNLFAKVAFYESYNERANFRSLGVAILTLFRMIRGGAWNVVMYDVAHHSSGCVADPPYDASMCGFHDYPGCVPLNGCGSNAIFPILTVYFVVNAFFVLEVFVGVVVSEFEAVQEMAVKKSDFEWFVDLWSRYDPQATGFMSANRASVFMSKLKAPLGFKDNAFHLNMGSLRYPHANSAARNLKLRKDILNRIGKLSVWDDEELGTQIQFTELLIILAAAASERRSGWSLPLEEYTFRDGDTFDLPTSTPERQRRIWLANRPLTFVELSSCVILQRAWRRRTRNLQHMMSVTSMKKEEQQVADKTGSPINDYIADCATFSFNIPWGIIGRSLANENDSKILDHEEAKEDQTCYIWPI